MLPDLSQRAFSKILLATIRFNSDHDGRLKIFKSDYRCQFGCVVQGSQRMLEVRVYFIGQEETESSLDIPVMIAFLKVIELYESGYAGARFELCEGGRVTGGGTVRAIATTASR
jgi:hypothetical protein